MNRKDITRIAQQAGDEEWQIVTKHVMKWFPDEVKRFVNLIAAAEYEKCQDLWMVLGMNNEQIADSIKAFVAAEREMVTQWMIAHEFSTGHGNSVADLLKELEWQIREQEREACAKVCDQWPDYDVEGLAAAIRARGTK